LENAPFRRLARLGYNCIPNSFLQFHIEKYQKREPWKNSVPEIVEKQYKIEL
jgi:hypothetical protein